MYLFFALLHVAVFFGVLVFGLVDALGIFGDAPDYTMAAVFSGGLIFWGVVVPWLYRRDRRRWRKYKRQRRETEERARAEAKRRADPEVAARAARPSGTSTRISFITTGPARGQPPGLGNSPGARTGRRGGRRGASSAAAEERCSPLSRA